LCSVEATSEQQALGELAALRLRDLHIAAEVFGLRADLIATEVPAQAERLVEDRLTDAHP